MLDVTVRRPIAPGDVVTIRRLDEVAEAADGHPSLGDSVWRDLAHPAQTSAIVVASLDGEPAGALHVAPFGKDGDESMMMAAVVHPRHRAADLERALLDAALADPHLGGHRTLLWVFGADARADRFTRPFGFTRERELWQMEVALPIEAHPRWPDGVDVRPFRVGSDEHAWLAVNNRAFADDPDQRGWDIERLEGREAEPWFDPAGFLLAWRDDDLIGFCWTRLHPPAPPHHPRTRGEIYVIGVDPAHRGIGLGRALVLGGLDVVHEIGAELGMLFVDAANAAAVGLYESLGFTTVRVDRAYVRTPR